MKSSEAKVTVLVENTVGLSFGLMGEWGLALLIEWAGRTILFDTGAHGSLLNNAAVLGADLRSVDTLVMSHGHWDHTGGMQSFLRRRGRLPVYAHPDFFAGHCMSAPHEHYNGVPYRQEELVSSGADFIFTTVPVQVAPGLWLSGEVPRQTSFETGDSRLYCLRGDERVNDPMADDMSLYGVTDQGLVIILGCAHAGLVNIIEYAKKVTGVDRIYGLIGGTHLGPVSKDQRDATLEYLSGLDLRYLAVNHCTGLPVMAQLKQMYGDLFHFAPCGTTLKLPTPSV